MPVIFIDVKICLCFHPWDFDAISLLIDKFLCVLSHDICKQLGPFCDINFTLLYFTHIIWLEVFMRLALIADMLISYS